jgi:hypothetical protein
VVREDAVNKDMLYLGTSHGIAFTTDGGNTWESLKLNLPPVPVYAMKVKGNSLVAGTYGRSFWIFDDLAALRELKPEVRTQPAALLDLPDAIRWRYSIHVAVPIAGGLGTPEIWKGTNPVPGASIYYWLNSKPKGEVRIQIFDHQQKLVNTLSSIGAKTLGYTDNMPPEKHPDLTDHPGLNLATWNLSWSGAKGIPDSKIKSGNPTSGPMVLPGVYTVKLTIDGQTETKSIRLSMDPRVHLSSAILKDNLDTSLAIRDEISHVTELVEKLRDFRLRVKSNPGLVEKLNELETRIHNVNAHVVYDLHSDPNGVRLYAQLIFLYSTAMGSDSPVTQGVRDTFAEERHQLHGYEEELTQLMMAATSK